MDWYIAVLKKYATFNGRARRQEYWMFFLFNLLFTLAAGLIDRFLGTSLIGGLYSLFILLPSVAVLVRRLHDIGRTGWWVLLSLIPVIGVVVLLFFAASEGMHGDNEYGPDPKIGTPSSAQW